MSACEDGQIAAAIEAGAFVQTGNVKNPKDAKNLELHEGHARLVIRPTGGSGSSFLLIRQSTFFLLDFSFQRSDLYGLMNQWNEWMSG